MSGMTTGSGDAQYEITPLAIAKAIEAAGGGEDFISGNLAEELFDLRDQLDQRMGDLMSPSLDYHFSSFWGDRCNSLSIVFAWLSRHPKLPEVDRAKMHKNAVMVCEFALRGPARLPDEGPGAQIRATYDSLLDSSPQVRSVKLN